MGTETVIGWQVVYPARCNFPGDMMGTEEYHSAPSYIVQANTVNTTLAKVAKVDGRTMEAANYYIDLEEALEHEHNDCSVCVIYNMAYGAVVPMWYDPQS